MQPKSKLTRMPHPLDAVFDDVVGQVTQGKGVRHGGEATHFMDQPWVHRSKYHGTGFLTGQAAKKLDEAQAKIDHYAWEREMLGAIAYAAMAVLVRREAFFGSGALRTSESGKIAVEPSRPSEPLEPSDKEEDYERPAKHNDD